MAYHGAPNVGKFRWNVFVDGTLANGERTCEAWEGENPGQSLKNEEADGKWWMVFVNFSNLNDLL